MKKAIPSGIKTLKKMDLQKKMMLTKITNARLDFPHPKKESRICWKEKMLMHPIRKKNHKLLMLMQMMASSK